jgi:hypothetical protein
MFCALCAVFCVLLLSIELRAQNEFAENREIAVVVETFNKARKVNKQLLVPET